ncbi:MAG TPA: hypothetical protein DEP84_37940 [Chloroflexi bacterium]|nr:hypothetical protein [Chloroflexota bacterium]
MEPTFSDRMLECAECGNQFVWTVAQQRQQYETTGRIEEPEMCPVCAVRMERMRAPVERVAAASERYTPRASVEGERSRGSSAASNHSPAEERRTTESEETTSGYVSGSGHPLYGHGGEEYTGHVKWFNDRKGFGFVTLDNGIEIFVHYSGIEGEGYKTLKQGQRVQIEVEDTEKGPQATHVKPIPEESGEPRAETDEE